MGRLVDAECLLLLHDRLRLWLLNLLSLDNKIVEFLIFIDLFLWRPDLLLFDRLGQLVMVPVEHILLVDNGVRKLLLHRTFTQKVFYFIA